MIARFFHIVEQPNRSWLRRHGLTEYDTHPELHQAIDHIPEIAARMQPAEVLVHRLEGGIDAAIPI